jgi:hypothetical protein
MFVPAKGDTFTYDLTFTNLTDGSRTFEYWTKVIGPGGFAIDPLLSPQALTLRPNETVLIDTTELPVPFNAVPGEYSLIVYAGTYQSDTVDTDTTMFTKLQSISCDEISSFRARCRPGGLIQARLSLTNTSHTGESIEFTIDQFPYQVTIGANGQAQFAQTGFNPGVHDVELTNPASCLPPTTVTCTAGMTKQGDNFWEDDESWEIPTATTLFDNYPNPFNPSTTFRYGLSEPAQVSLKIYNTLGQLVKTVVDEFQAEGYYTPTWDGKNDEGESVASGLYIYRFSSGTFVDSKKMMLMK